MKTDWVKRIKKEKPHLFILGLGFVVGGIVTGIWPISLAGIFLWILLGLKIYENRTPKD